MKNALRQIRNYPSAVFGLFIILFLVALAIYAVIAIPYSEAVRLWRGEDNVWLETPRKRPPRLVLTTSTKRKGQSPSCAERPMKTPRKQLWT